MHVIRSLLNVLAEGTTSTTTIDFSGLITALNTAITPEQLLAILTSVIGVGMAFVLMWFGVRKLIRIFSSALQSGRLRI